MLPKFPNFKKLELSDREFIINFARKFPPYSDYNFTSMWCWNTQNSISISTLNDNLVVEFLDYITSKKFLSFLGKNKVDDTVEKVILYARAKGMPGELKLVGDEIAMKSNKKKFSVKEDIDNFDYILSVDQLRTYAGNSLRGKRNFVHRFNKNYEATTQLLNIQDDEIKKQILEMFFLWADHKNLSIDDARNEFTAISRLFDQKSRAEFVNIGVYVDGRLIGFTINEVMGNGYALLHFEKCNARSHIGVYPYVMQQTALMLAKRECQYINYEQDLGIEGLRQGKSSYSPCYLLKKYILTPVEK